MSTNQTRRLLAALVFWLVPALSSVAPAAQAPASAPAPGSAPERERARDATPRWIWMGPEPKADQTVYFRKEFVVDAPISSAKLSGSCDNRMTVFLNGDRVVEGKEWVNPTAVDLTGRVRRGRNVLAVEAHNEGGLAGLLLRLAFEGRRPVAPVFTDASWRVSERAGPGWQAADFNDSAWTAPVVIAALGEAPWQQVNEKSLLAAIQSREPPATPISRLKIAKGFKVDLLYSVPKDTQGSWVSMALDPRGRLIVSDQYGKLYRVKLPPASATGPAATPEVEPIDVEIGEAQGLVWAFDSLYVVVNSGGKFKSGLYRVRDTDGDDRLDTVESLRPIQGGGEHGPHGIVPSPDGKSLYVVAGNATRPMELAGSLVPKLYDEDQILPRQPDGRGFMKDETAPGGCIYRIDPDGKRWELVSMGYRNPYDLAFNRDGELFTYDSDMEWDINLPWYRPTRVCQAVSGSEFGYRGGSGKWPTYYPDSLPPAVDIGPGSPTGVTFGTGAKFPAKYQQALYICDWSYGKLYAVHLTPDHSAYTGALEEFITGTPLPLTDILVNPHDGAMYFAIGGRRTKSGLYRVTYAGPESTAPAPADLRGAEDRKLRHELEALHGHADPNTVAAAWPHLGHPDRFIRFAARVAIEWQDPASWQERALSERGTPAALTALLALARAGDKALQPRILQALDRIDWESLSESQKLELIRVYDVTFIRMGAPDPETTERTIERFDPYYPAGRRNLNTELCKLFVYLQAPSAAARGLALLEKAPTQEEQIDYVTALRMLKTGWTPELRKAYFSWFQKAAGYRGGASFELFLLHIKQEAVAALSDSEKDELKPILDAATPAAAAPRVAVAEGRPFVKAWTVDELSPLVEKGLTRRNYDRGRALFSTVGCFACHRFNNEGGAVGPDLTGISGRFSPRDLLESIITPSKEISDQYGAVMIALDDGRVVTGRIVNLHGDTMMVLTDMLNPNALVGVNQNQIEDMKPSPVSMMPEGLLNTLDREEILDLMAYLLSRGQRDDRMFQAGR
jgi:putative heme-binding domain-containing protein